MNKLTLSLLGALQIKLNGKQVSGFDSDKVRALFIYLAVETDRPHRRDTLAEMLWPDKPEGVGRKNLRQALANLRKVIGDRGATSPYLLSSRDEIQFNSGSSHWIDILEFQELLASIKTHSHESLDSCSVCVERLNKALGLYEGDFLDQFYLPDSQTFGDWTNVRREAFQRQMSDALRIIISIQERKNEFPGACESARRLIALEPWNEGNHRVLMRLLALNGMRSAALKQYHTCRQILADELGVEPAKETTDLYEQVKEWKKKILSGGDLSAALAEKQKFTPDTDPMEEPKRKFSGRYRVLLYAAIILAAGYALISWGIDFSINQPTDQVSEKDNSPDLTTTEDGNQVKDLNFEESPTDQISDKDNSPDLPTTEDGYKVGNPIIEDIFDETLSNIWSFGGQWETIQVNGRTVLVANYKKSTEIHIDTQYWDQSLQQNYLVEFDFFLSRPSIHGYYSLIITTRDCGCGNLVRNPSLYLLDIGTNGVFFLREAFDQSDRFERKSLFSVSPGEWHTIQIYNYPNTYQVIIDSTEIFNFSIDNPILMGTVTFRVDQPETEYYVDNFQVYELIPDTDAP